MDFLFPLTGVFSVQHSGETQISWTLNGKRCLECLQLILWIWDCKENLKYILEESGNLLEAPGEGNWSEFFEQILHNKYFPWKYKKNELEQNLIIWPNDFRRFTFALKIFGHSNLVKYSSRGKAIPCHIPKKNYITLHSIQGVHAFMSSYLNDLKCPLSKYVCLPYGLFLLSSWW